MSNNGWQTELIKRCRSVGWSVDKTTSNHFKVCDKAGKLLFSIPSTAGDARARRNSEADARRAGLETLEQHVKLRDERDRLARIELDRIANGAGDVSSEASLVPSANGAAPRDIPRDAAQPLVDLGTVGDVAITEIAPALLQTPVTDRPAELADGQELLLADGRVVYRCCKTMSLRSPRAGELCHQVFDSAGSLSSHMGAHSRRPRAPKTDGISAPAPAPAETVAAPAAEAEASAVARIARRVDDLHNTVTHMIGSLQNVILDLSSVQHDLSTITEADPKMLEKAARFDAMREAFKVD